MTASDASVVYVLLSYNQAAFVEDAVRSALSQDYSPLTILISDDASSDQTFSIIETVVADYAGPHRIRLNRNVRRMGSVDHLARIADLVDADAFIVMAHADDVAMSARTRLLVDAWQSQKVAMVSSDAHWFGGQAGRTSHGGRSRHIKAAEMIEIGWIPEMLGATLAFEAALLTAQPLSSRSLGCGLDHVLPFRATLDKGLYYLAVKLVRYRRHAGNMSNVISDRTGRLEGQHETSLAYDIAIRYQQRRDLLASCRARRFDLRRWLLLRQLERRIINDIGLWSELRATLKTDGLSATWIPTTELQAREILWEVGL